MFQQCKQKVGETVDIFATALHRLVTHSGYRALKNELEHDRMLMGLQELKLPKILQTDTHLTLVTVVWKARQKEAVQQQQAIVHQEN